MGHFALFMFNKCKFPPNIQLSSYFCFDNVAVLHDALKSHLSSLGDNFEFYFNLLYSVYSLPNVFLPIMGGFMIYQLGMRVNYLLFGFLIGLGQFTFALGCEAKSINIMLIGRLIFGLGGECIGICQNALLWKWFFKSEIGFPLGLSISLGRIGSILNSSLSPKLSNWKGVSFPIWVGFAACLVSFLSISALCAIDRRFQFDTDKDSLYDDQSNKAITPRNRQLSLLFWLILGLSLTFYGAISSFNNIASGFLVDTWYNEITKEEAIEKAGMCMSIPFCISLILIPFIGCLNDRYGKRVYLLMFSPVISIIAFILFYFCNPVIPYLLIGISYSIFASTIWPCLYLILTKDILSYAFGLVSSLQNLTLMICPMLFALFFSLSKSFYSALLLFIFLLALGLILSILLYLEDESQGVIINKAHGIYADEKEEEIIRLAGNEIKQSWKVSFLSHSVMSVREDLL